MNFCRGGSNLLLQVKIFSVFFSWCHFRICLIWLISCGPWVNFFVQCGQNALPSFLSPKRTCAQCAALLAGQGLLVGVSKPFATAMPRNAIYHLAPPKHCPDKNAHRTRCWWGGLLLGVFFWMHWRGTRPTYPCWQNALVKQMVSSDRSCSTHNFS